MLQPSAAVRRATSKLAGKTILIVDDEPLLALEWSMRLEKEQARVARAANGEQALELLQKGLKPHIVVLDMLMPVTDGWGFLERLKKHAAALHAPVIIVTGIRAASEEWALSLGGAACLRKPIEADELIEAIKRHCPG